MIFCRQFAVLSALSIFFTANASAQAKASPFELPATNSRAIVQQQVASTDIEINYSRPSVKGRKIFGDLVPFGQVWRTGSDATTKISFSTPVNMSGTPVDSGSYELFTIPGETEWVVILQKNRSQWGSYSYDPGHDAARFTVKPVPSAAQAETFTISLDDITTNSALLNITWDTIRVPVLLEIDVRQTVVPKLEEVLKGEGRRPYFRAAMFYFENDLDINRAAELIALALDNNPGHIGMLYRQALILERKGDLPGAIEAAEQSLAGASSAADELRNEYSKLNQTLLERLKSRMEN